MPKVGKKHYPYTHAGRRAAKAAAKKKGKKVRYTEGTYERMSHLIFEFMSEKLSKRDKARLNIGERDPDKVRAAQTAYDKSMELYGNHEVAHGAYLHALRTHMSG